jgi:hypothetical protein
MLEKEKNKVLPCGRNSMGALDSALSSIPFGVCVFRFLRQPQALFKITLGIFKKRFVIIIVWQIFWIQPDIPNDNPNNNETRTKKSHNHDRPDASPLLAEKIFFLAHIARPR